MLYLTNWMTTYNNIATNICQGVVPIHKVHITETQYKIKSNAYAYISRCHKSRLLAQSFTISTRKQYHLSRGTKTK